MKKTLLLILTVVAVLLFATSCNTLRIRMGERSYFYLLPLSAVPEPVDSYQLITGSFPGYENVAIEAWFTSGESSLNLVMFAPTGQTMGKVFYDGQKLNFESSFLPEYRIIGMYMQAPDSTDNQSTDQHLFPVFQHLIEKRTQGCGFPQERYEQTDDVGRTGKDDESGTCCNGQDISPTLPLVPPYRKVYQYRIEEKKLRMDARYAENGVGKEVGA